VPKDVCGQGATAVWATPVITPPSATINAPITAFTVINELDCVKTGSLVVEKKVKYDGPITLPNLTYPVTVTCGSTVTNLNLVNGVPQTVSNIPLNTSCSVVEGTVPTPPNICKPPLTPSWSTTYVPPSPITVTGAATMEIVNTLVCKAVHTCLPPFVLGPADQCICPPGTVLAGKECVKSDKTDVAIKKTVSTSPVPQVVDYYFTLAVTNVGSVFNGQNVITVTDVVPAGMSFTSVSGGANWSCTPAPIPAGGTLTCTYTGTGPTAPNQALGSIAVVGHASQPPPFTNCAIVGFTPASGLTDANPPDNQSCINVVKPPFPVVTAVCDPRTTVKRGTECVCRFPNMVKSSESACACREGMNFVPGRGCVPPLVCPPPKIPNAANTACLCPEGTVPRGRECVKPPACQPPMVPGPIAGQCICPQGMVQQGRRCVPLAECRPPQIRNPAGTACICPPGTVQRGRTCEQPKVCNPPARLNRQGQCECPRDMVARGNSCIARERQLPGLTPGIRGFPGGGFPGGFPGGGRDTPGGPRGQGQGESPGRR
jgi:uncharacterized repeat protein (TIGR01451 family)